MIAKRKTSSQQNETNSSNLTKNKNFPKTLNKPDSAPTNLIVDKLDALHIDAVVLVFFLLHLEDVLVEVLLQFLVRIVDAQLLEAVDWRVCARGRVSAREKEKLRNSR